MRLYAEMSACADVMAEIKKNDFNLNISRYISTAVAEEEIDLVEIHHQTG